MKNRILLALAIVLFSLSPLQWTSGQPNVVSPPGAWSFPVPVFFQSTSTFNGASTFNAGLTVPVGQTLTVNGTCTGCGPAVTNVQNYGAKGDGVTNDLAAIQAAATVAASDGVLYFPTGTYKLAGACSLTIGSLGHSTSIIGANYDTTTIDASGCSGSFNVLTFPYQTSNVFTMSNINIKGPGSGVNRGLLTNGWFKISLWNVAITNFGNSDAFFSGTKNVFVQNSYFSNSGGSSLGLILDGVGGQGAVINTYTGGISIGPSSFTRDISVINSLLDDAAPASVQIGVGGSVQDIILMNDLVFQSSGNTAIKIGDGVTTPARTTLQNLRVLPFDVFSIANTIAILAGATDTVLDNVSTALTAGGADISDAGTNTRYVNVKTNSASYWIQQGTSGMGVTEKTGSGAGNYTTVSTTYFNVDAANLVLQSATVPTGWKDHCRATASVDTNSLGATLNLALADGGTVKREQTMIQAVASDFATMSVAYVVPGDGAVHTITLQWKVSAGTATMANSTATLTPNLICMLMPSN